MDMKDVIYHVSLMEELDDKERESVTAFLIENETEISIADEVVAGGTFNDDFYNVTVDGPDGFFLSYEKGCSTDYVNLLELDDETSTTSFKKSYSIDISKITNKDNNEE